MAKVTVTFSGEFVGEYPLDRPASIVGRDATADIQIDNLGVSRAHCQFVKRGDDYILQDMNSANGTYVNGEKVGEHYLKDGDEALVGKFLLKFDAAGTAAAPKAAAAESPPDVMDDGLRTYVVDGAAIRERLAVMHEAETERQAAPVGGPLGEPGMATPAPKQVGLPGPPPGPRRAADHALAFDPLKPRTKPGTQHLRRPSPAAAAAAAAPADGGAKLILYMSLLINLVLIGLVVMLLVMMQKITDKIESAPSLNPGSAITAPDVYVP